MTLERPRKNRHTSVSRHPRGLGTIVTVSFAPRGSGTFLELYHANNPDHEFGWRHKPGWEHYLDTLEQLIGGQEGETLWATGEAETDRCASATL